MSTHSSKKPVAQDTPVTHEEASLDNAVEDTFPASDPVAGVPSGRTTAATQAHQDAELDEGIELTFPASDPVAVSGITKVVPKKPA